MKSSAARVAAIDIGSNTVKALVATRDGNGRIQALEQRTLDARISAGISESNMGLTEDAMQTGIKAVTRLMAMISSHHPTKIRIVATSAVRESSNGGAFAQRVKDVTGHQLLVLDGEEEARLIGRGLLCDPAMAQWRDFHVCDLGGGSMEVLTFHDRQLQRAHSLPLGCVRLTEKFVADRRAPLRAREAKSIRSHVHHTLRSADVEFLENQPPVAFTGGTITTTRAMVAAFQGASFNETAARVTVEALEAQLRTLSRLSEAERRRFPGLPPPRADVMPTALVTVIALAEFARVTEFQHSLYNLRWGLADSLLS